jgi:hypothetical protein
MVFGATAINGVINYFFPVAQDVSLLHVVQTDSRAHPASYPWVQGGKAAEA